MAESSTSPEGTNVPVRKRKAHKKSKAGCEFCKLRRVKCDESRPSCRNCVKFMANCSYSFTKNQAIGDASSSTQNTTAQPAILNALSINDALLRMINTTLRANYPKNYEPLVLDLADVEGLRRWQTRTVLTVGSPATAAVYQREVIKLVARFPYLMHSVLALTTKHDRYLSPKDPKDAERQRREFYHYERGAALFNRTLSSHKDPHATAENDALWSCAVFMGSLASATVDGESPEDVWPMKDGTFGEALTWLMIQEGLRILWYFSQPYAPGRIFHELIEHPEHKYMKTKLDPRIPPGTDGIPPDFVKLCGIDDGSTMLNNPYHKAVRNLVALIDLDFTPVNMLKFMSFTALVNAEFKQLLLEKDPPALVLLAWWYAFMLKGHWSIARRAMLECRSICIYLGRTCPEDTHVQKMLALPRDRTGLSNDVEKLSSGSLCQRSPEQEVVLVM